MCKLVLLFLLVPLLELWLLIEVGRALGTWPTIILVFLTGFIGVLLAGCKGWRCCGIYITSWRRPGAHDKCDGLSF